MAMIKRSSGRFQTRLNDYTCYGARPTPRNRPAGFRLVRRTDELGVKTSGREARS